MQISKFIHPTIGGAQIVRDSRKYIGGVIITLYPNKVTVYVGSYIIKL